jgi:hypothetical protein
MVTILTILLGLTALALVSFAIIYNAVKDIYKDDDIL